MGKAEKVRAKSCRHFGVCQVLAGSKVLLNLPFWLSACWCRIVIFLCSFTAVLQAHNNHLRDFLFSVVKPLSRSENTIVYYGRIEMSTRIPHPKRERKSQLKIMELENANYAHELYSHRTSYFKLLTTSASSQLKH